MEYYSAAKMNELELNTLTWMNIVDIMRSKTQKFQENTQIWAHLCKFKIYIKVNRTFYKDTNIRESYRKFHDNDTYTPQIQNSDDLWRGGKEMKSGRVAKGL